VKLIWNLFIAFMIFNLLLVAGFVGLKYNSGYINQERIDSVLETFSLTIDEEADQVAKNDQLEEETQQLREQSARLEAVGNGPTTLREELDKAQQADETSLERIKFFNNQNRALRQEMARFKEDHSRRVKQLDQEREAFEQMVKDRADQTEDVNFKQVVGLYETQAPKQTKQAFQALMAQGDIEQVVEYLAAMSSRKAGKVLAQFKTPVEVPQAADLLERLRKRGEFTLGQQTPTAGNQS
jgi:hypothetical protein